MIFYNLRRLFIPAIVTFMLSIPVIGEEGPDSSSKAATTHSSDELTEEAEEEENTSVSSLVGGIRKLVFGYGSTEFGQIVHGQYSFARTGDGKLDHYWIERTIVQIGLSLKNDNGLGVALAGEGQIYFPYAGPGDGAGFGYELLMARYKWYPHQAEVSYSIGELDSPVLSVGLGFFPFKYNPDGRNFGDYLFRLSTYPQYMPTSFDSPYQRLLGLRISSRLFSTLKQDLLLTSEVYLWPLKDFSFTYLIGYNFFGFAEIGGGVMGHRLFSVDERLTTPTKLDQNGKEFSFAGTKVMFRMAFDFKRFLPMPELWGKNDMRLYGEACINGLKSYPVTDSTDPTYPGYNDIKKRIPISFGFNVPTYKILDVLSIEAEWWDAFPLLNSYWGVYPIGYKQNPFPDVYPLKPGTSPRHFAYPYGGAWHWSVYAKKTFLHNLAIKAQFARDHSVIETTLTGTSNADPQEAMDGLGNWAWMCKIEYDF